MAGSPLPTRVITGTLCVRSTTVHGVTSAGINHEIDAPFELFANFMRVAQCGIVTGQQQSGGHQRLTQFGEQRTRHAMRRNTHAYGLALGM